MRWTELCRAACLALLTTALAGCAHEDPTQSSTKAAAALAAIPLSLRGRDTLMRITFPRAEQTVEPGQLLAGEVCYLAVGTFRIDCYSNGSSLNLGPNDSTDLLTDCPLFGLSPLRDDKAAAEALKLYAVLSLVGGSVDRLPGALADYLAEPGQHWNEAIELSRLLFNEKQMRFEGHARGGNFMVSVELTDAGRDKLADAIDEAGEPKGVTQMAGSVSKERAVRATTRTARSLFSRTRSGATGKP